MLPPWNEVEASLRESFARGDALANDRAIATLARSCGSAKDLSGLFELEVLEDATIGSEDGHGAETTEALLSHVRAGGRLRPAAVTLAATLAAPTLRSLFREDGLDEPKREARERVAAFDGTAVLLRDGDPKVRLAGWSLLARGEPLGLEATDDDDDVIATMHLCRAVIRAAPDPSELERRGLRGWAAALASVRAAHVVGGAAGERLLLATAGRPLRIPASWGFGETTAAALTSEVLHGLDVEPSLLDRVIGAMDGEQAPRRIAALALGPMFERDRAVTFARVPSAGLRPDQVTPLVREVVRRLGVLAARGTRDHAVDSALGIGPGEHDAFLEAAGSFAPWSLPGFAGAPFHWLHRAVVLGGPPDVEALASHLLTLAPSVALDRVLARMPRALLAAQIAAQSDRAAAWARDAALLDRLAPTLQPELAARLGRYVVLGPDCPRALGRLVRTAGLDGPGAAERIADAVRVYGE